MGEIVKIGSGDGTYEYQLPVIPKESDILYYDLPKKMQYWKTEADTKNLLVIQDVKKMSEKQRIEYINLWRERWLNGMWFMCNGKPTYITGSQVDHLVFNEFQGRKLRYLDSQRERFYFRDLTNNDPLCSGRCWIKPRRAGISTEQITEAIRVVLNDFSNNVVFQSDTLYKSMSTLMKPTIDTYSRRVSWMRERYYAPNGKKPIKSLELKSNMVEQEGDRFLGGMIEALPTVASAADGKDAALFVEDEFSKYESCDPYEMLEINLKAVNPDKPLKIDCLSTTGDSKDVVKATMAWHKLIANSNPLRRNANGKTNSGLYKYFVEGIHSLLLLKEMPDVIDLYGNINRDMAEEWIWNEHKKYTEGTKEYIFSLYKFPLIEEHALLSSAISNLFNKLRISSRLSHLESLSPDKKPYVRGKLEEQQDGKIYFVADSTGLWLWAIHPYFSVEKNIDTRNKYRKYDGVFFPPLNMAGVVGYDPVNFHKEDIKSSNFSQACLFVRIKFDYFNCGIEDEVMAMYLGRPDDPHDVNKEAIKACKYTGFGCMHERSTLHVKEDFIESRMLPFLMKGDDGNYGITTSPKIINNGVSMLQARYSTPKEPNQKDQFECYPFEDGLRSLDNFDPGNTTQFDVTMAEIMCENGLKQLQFSNATDNSGVEWNKRMLEFMPTRN